MKKFFLIALVVGVLAAGGYYAVYHGGYYLDVSPGAPADRPFRAAGTQWACEIQEGVYEPLILRGVDVAAFLPGHSGTEFFAEEEDYLRWLEHIGAMGANAVRVSLIMDSAFYDALYAYNSAHERPLYLLQGVRVSDYANNNSLDAYDEDFLDKLVRDGKGAVDIIHGRKDIALNDEHGSGFYRKDISPWVLGYLVGAEWNADTITYTDHNLLRSGVYAGEYFSASPEATAFEAMLAQVMDRITAYETAKYKTQRPIGFINSQETDFLEYAPVYGKQLSKYARVDAEHVVPSAEMAAGTFAAYSLKDFCQDFLQYLSEAQKTSLSDVLAHLDSADSYGGYLDLLTQYHSMPVIAAGYGFSSARGAVQMDKAPLSEKEQGEQLVRVSDELEARGWTGGFISAWQDVWGQRTWNTAFSSSRGRGIFWHDLQTEAQGYGLMAFDPGKRETVCRVDGLTQEWQPADVVFDHNGIQVSLKYDETGLYVLVRQPGLSPSDTLYLPLDVCPRSGSLTCQEPGLAFAREADFLLCLSGTEDSRLLVQERYDAARQRFLFEISGVNAYVNFPGKESPAFVPVTMALKNTLILDGITPEGRMQQRLKTWETGKLIHGIGDPGSWEFNSLADFCYGQDAAEIRLPWTLLNFYDPSLMQVHDDYYDHYGVEGLFVKEIYIGAMAVGEAEPVPAAEPVPMSAAVLRGWGNAESYHERLKQSYYVLRESWGEGYAN